MDSTSTPADSEENWLALLMKRRKTVSVTPAMGASTVAGATRTLPTLKLAGTRASAGMACSNGASHFFCSSVYRFFIVCERERPPPGGGLSGCFPVIGYFVAALAAALPASALATLRRKRSTRPAVSTSFCLPVKNGWHCAQISTTMSPLLVERVSNVFPQAHFTWIASYFGCIPSLGIESL